MERLDLRIDPSAYEGYAKFCRLLGYRVEITPSGLWIGKGGNAVFQRVPPCVTQSPHPSDLSSLIEKRAAVAMLYAVPPGQRGGTGYVNIIRKRHFGLDDLASGSRRWDVRKGLRHCTVRRMSFGELQQAGAALNRETLARQRRRDPWFDSPAAWERFCSAGNEVDSVEVCGAWVDDVLAAYAVGIQVGPVFNGLYHMSRTALMDKNPSSALYFTIVSQKMASPGVELVCAGSSFRSTAGVDRFKERMGFERAPVTVRLDVRWPLQILIGSDLANGVLNRVAPWLIGKDRSHTLLEMMNLARLSSASAQ